ncbi:MAG: hypothetical protein JW703_01135 [Candidatus Diapherotrites archaeon]|nr:hypothetical protein [Candidatus Diapherotrites archaeon]
MNKGFASLGLLFAALACIAYLSEINLMQEKELGSALALMNSINSGSLKRTETELLFDSAIENALKECAEKNIFSNELIHEKIAENLINEIKFLEENKSNCSIAKKNVSIQEIKNNSAILTELFETTYIIEFIYSGNPISCIFESSESSSVAMIPTGFILIKEGLIGIN